MSTPAAGHGRIQNRQSPRRQANKVAQRTATTKHLETASRHRVFFTERLTDQQGTGGRSQPLSQRIGHVTLPANIETARDTEPADPPTVRGTGRRPPAARGTGRRPPAARHWTQTARGARHWTQTASGARHRTQTFSGARHRTQTASGARHWTPAVASHTRLASTPPSTHASWPSRRARSRSHCVRARCTWPGCFGFVCSATQPGRTGTWADRARESMQRRLKRYRGLDCDTMKKHLHG